MLTKSTWNLHTCAEKPCHYNILSETILALVKERRKPIRKNTEETKRKETDRKKEYWV